MNAVTLIGNVGKAPEILSFENGKKIAKFSIATSETFKKQDGTKEETTTWHNIVVFGKPAELIEKYVNKGDKLAIQGKISNRKYETKEGETKYAFEIIANSFEFVSSKKTETENSAETFIKEGDDDLPF